MPASAPSAGLDRRYLLASGPLRNHGTDTSVNYQVALWNPVTGVGFLAGNNDYVGLLSGGIFGPLIQGAALPQTSNAVTRGAVNFRTGSWYLVDAMNDVFRMSAGLTVATDITPPAANTRNGIAAYGGNLFTAVNNLTIPNRQLEVSTDDGVTWDSNPGVNTGNFVSTEGIYTNAAETFLLVIFTGGTAFAWTESDDGLTDWNLETSPGAPQNDAAISSDGTRAVVVSANGGISTMTGVGNWSVMDVDNNPFQSTATTGQPLISVQYVDALGGFVIVTGTLAGFIDENDMSRAQVGAVLGDTVTLPTQTAISDGEQLLVPASNNEAYFSLREIGQTGLS